MNDHSKIEDEAADWIVSRESLDWNIDREEELKSWLAQNDAHRAAYWRLENAWRRADRIAELGHNADEPNSHTNWIRPALLWPGLIAASLGLFLVAGIVYRSHIAPTRSDEQRIVLERIATPIGGYKAVKLNDGSTVELNTATQIRTSVKTAQREVWLDQGEAYFQVAHRRDRRFVVHVGEKTVTVLGTKFLVKREGSDVVVSVVEGRVGIAGHHASRAGSTAPVVVAAAEMAVAKQGSNLVTLSGADRVETELAWRQGLLIFDQATLAEAAAEFNRYNERKIVISDAKVAAVSIGGTFRTSAIDSFSRLLHVAYGLRVESDQNEIRISS